MISDSTPVFIAGYGYTGRRVAERWMERGVKVRALTRRPIRLAEHMHPRLELLRGDLDEPASLPTGAIAGTRLYYFAPPRKLGDIDERMRDFVAALDEPPEKIVLISTTGVYGDCNGEWVDESRPPNPGSDRARRRLDAERVISEWASRRGVPLAILRVAGIYGPGCLPEKRLQERTPMPAARDCGYTNRIHIDDLVEACVQVMAQPGATGVFNASDGAPGTMREYFDLVADALGYDRLPVLPREQMAATLNTRMQAYLGESRRIDNSRLRDTLGLSLRYPDLASALAAGSLSE
ncbi:MAG TPA: SDR family oxidoreductase [Arenicellales bacterium]|nr:SDR family oxidoreductase [Arenicellales bacterium]